MAGDLNRFPGGEIFVGLAKQRRVIGAKLAKLFRIIRLLRVLKGFQLVNLLFEAGQRLFEVQDVSAAAGTGGLAVRRPGDRRFF